MFPDYVALFSKSGGFWSRIHRNNLADGYGSGAE
jgi:hypothetical protein